MMPSTPFIINLFMCNRAKRPACFLSLDLFMFAHPPLQRSNQNQLPYITAFFFLMYSEWLYLLSRCLLIVNMSTAVAQS